MDTDDEDYKTYDAYEEVVYEEVEKLENKLDKFECFLITAMNALEEDGRADFVLLKNKSLREWWAAFKISEAKRVAFRIEEARKLQVKTDALAKLTTEEKKLLGLIK